MPFRIVKDELKTIKIIGVGGGGSNAINTMVLNKLTGVEFIAADTRFKNLEKSRADIRIQLGPNITKGMGAGSDPAMGREAALQSSTELKNCIKGSDMVFVTAGLGGGTGTGAVPEIARLSREAGALTVAVVTKPFCFEGKKRMRNAEEGLEKLKEYVDTTITIPNDHLLSLKKNKSTLIDMLQMADTVLLKAVRSITDLINQTGLINVDFADLRSVMKDAGTAILSTGTADGENRATVATKRAIDNPFLENASIDGAREVLVNISATESTLTLTEFEKASALIHEKVHEDANVIVGALFDDTCGKELRITLIATGLQL